jgi:hypothetical protein
MRIFVTAGGKKKKKQRYSGMRRKITLAMGSTATYGRDTS